MEAGRRVTVRGRHVEVRIYIACAGDDRRAAKSPGVLVVAALAFLVGVCLTVAIVRWSTRRLGLPVEEALLWFGLLERVEPYGSTKPRRIA